MNEDSNLLTILVIYDGLCSLGYSTDLLQDGCFACIGPSYDQNTKIWAFISVP